MHYINSLRNKRIDRTENSRMILGMCEHCRQAISHVVNHHVNAAIIVSNFMTAGFKMACNKQDLRLQKLANSFQLRITAIIFVTVYMLYYAYARLFIFDHIFTQVRKHQGYSGEVPPKSFLCLPKFFFQKYGGTVCFEHVTKTKILPP